jgi:uncharacterized protein YbaP (TraB family)
VCHDVPTSRSTDLSASTCTIEMARYRRTITWLPQLALFAWLLAVRPTAAQSSPGTPVAPAAKPAAAKHAATPVFLWRVTSPTATVYLLGSVHVASKAMYPLDARIEQAFKSADTLVLETELDATAQLQAATALQQAGMYTPPDSLDKHLDPATWQKIERAATKLGLPVQAVAAMRPWLASLTLTILELQTLGYQAQLGIDQHFHDAAGKRRVAALETIEEQVRLFRDMSEATQLAALRQTLEQIEELPALMRRAMELWRKGDVAAFDALMIAPTRKDYPELYRRLLVDRNRGITDTIEGYLAGKGTVFVVVGSGHLVGADSIVRMLKGRGHAPTQL